MLEIRFVVIYIKKVGEVHLQMILIKFLLKKKRYLVTDEAEYITDIVKFKNKLLISTDFGRVVELKFK